MRVPRASSRDVLPAKAIALRLTFVLELSALSSLTEKGLYAAASKAQGLGLACIQSLAAHTSATLETRGNSA